MPIARFEMPDGRVARFEVPDGTTPEQAQSMMSEHFSGETQPQAPQPQQPPKTSLLSDIKQGAGNLVAGATRGAGSIGATILYPWDKGQDLYYGDRKANLSGVITGKQPLSRNEERRAAMDEGLRMMGAEPDSLIYQGGKIGGEIAGTAGIGGVLAKGVQGISQAPRALQLANALRTGGFRAGATPGIVAAATRATGGAISGGAMAGMVNPEDAGTGALIGGALPGVANVAGKASKFISDKAIKPAANRLMQSAIKPTLKQLKTGDARVATETLLKYGINPNQRGVEKLQYKIDDINSLIANKLQNSGATVNRNDVVNYLGDVRTKFANQVSPTSDLGAIQGIADDFMTHPGLTGNNIPVQQAQALKQGTYKALSGKYGEAGSAATEAQKALARGLKDNIANAIPGIGQLNAEEARLLKTLSVAERRALMEVNKNPVGLAALAGNPIGFAAFMADKSALFKSLVARGINQTAKAPGLLGGVSRGLESPVVRAGLLGTQTD